MSLCEGKMHVRYEEANRLLGIQTKDWVEDRDIGKNFLEEKPDCQHHCRQSDYLFLLFQLFHHLLVLFPRNFAFSIATA